MRFGGSMQTELCLRLGLEHLSALVHAGLQVNVVWAAQLPRILVLDIGRLLERIGGSAHPAPRGRGFSFGDGHGGALLMGRPKSVRKAALIEDRRGER